MYSALDFKTFPHAVPDLWDFVHEQNPIFSSFILLLKSVFDQISLFSLQ